jgi:transposase
MEVVYARCAGIDVHKRMLMTQARLAQGGKVQRELRECGTFTKDLLALRDWLKELGVTHVAMEATGSFWRPVYNILEGEFEILVCNAHHIKNVPGRKTDVKDAEWISELLAHGLLKPSFVPEAPQRALRDLTRTRSTFVAERARIANRIQKLLEEANIKLASVATDVLGASGRQMLRALVGGQEDPHILAEMSLRRLRKKIPQLQFALEGRIRPHQRIVLGELLKQVESLDLSIDKLEEAIQQELDEEGNRPFETAVALLTSVPGIGTTSARAIVSEIGPDMDRFGSAERLCAWAGVAPGNHQSGGKRLSGKTLHGNRSLMTTLAEAATAAARTKDTYLAALYRRLSLRRGKRKAVVALAHSMLRSVYYMLKSGAVYHDLGPNHFDRINYDKTVKRLEKRAGELGYCLMPATTTTNAAT